MVSAHSMMHHNSTYNKDANLEPKPNNIIITLKSCGFPIKDNCIIMMIMEPEFRLAGKYTTGNRDILVDGEV